MIYNDVLVRQRKTKRTFIFHLDRLTNECEIIKKQIRDLKSNLTEPFQGSEDELELILKNFQRDQEKKKRELQECEQKKISIENQLKKLIEKRTSEINRLGGYEFEEKQYKSHLQRYQTYLNEYEQHDKNEFLVFFQRKLDNENRNLNEKRLVYQQKEDRLQNDIDQSKEQKIKIESSIKLKSAQVESTLKEIQDLKHQQKQIEQYAKQLTDLNQRIDTKEKEYQDKFTQNTSIETLKFELNADEHQRSQIQNELKSLSQEIDHLHANAKINTEFEMFKKDKAERDEQIRKMYENFSSRYAYRITF